MNNNWKFFTTWCCWDSQFSCSSEKKSMQCFCMSKSLLFIYLSYPFGSWAQDCVIDNVIVSAELPELEPVGELVEAGGVGDDPSAQTQVGLVLSPHGLGRGRSITSPLAHVQVGLPPSAHCGLCPPGLPGPPGPTGLFPFPGLPGLFGPFPIPPGLWDPELEKQIIQTISLGITVTKIEITYQYV